MAGGSAMALQHAMALLRVTRNFKEATPWLYCVDIESTWVHASSLTLSC
jgi:hypothetical protein